MKRVFKACLVLLCTLILLTGCAFPGMPESEPVFYPGADDLRSEEREETETPTAHETSGETEYVLNTNTKRFHLPTCSSVDEMKPENREDYTGDRETLIQEGYKPCGKCKP